MTKRCPSQEMDRFNVRMPTGMRGEIAKLAKKNGRSMNSELIEMLKFAIEHKEALDSDKISLSISPSVIRAILSPASPEKTTILALLKDVVQNIQQIEKTLRTTSAKKARSNNKGLFRHK
ncbi:Arc family DNA-binding protein [Xenorhabdus ehlersii]|uniref:Arc-like DNA binding dprotein n=1 Tax=Xenorhabdus ehlersii TaxID=290111 RepID=A0A2D0IPJ2_9GAMM|nr:Arc family DNA-binding protein [Xenorhabdus ehlersii]PHM23701.1 hypothetical protein Xehl_02704 [Xenorhabdus ehlersii]RKE92695.1 Arc-like DNA binding dprotein [Xenorhabdus ehlersii]